MSYGPIRGGLALLVLGGAGTTGLVLTRPLVPGELPAPHSSAPPAAGSAVDLVLNEGVVERAIGRPPFRADRRAPVAGYNPERTVVPETHSAPPAPKPALAISGIVWGDAPAAVVEGLPGIESSVVLRLGESAAGLRVVGIQETRVVIRGMDTTWRLTVREPW